MKLLKFAPKGLFVILLSVVISSCSSSSDNSQMRRGSLNFSTENYTVIPETDQNGIWKASVTFDLDNIDNLYPQDRLQGIGVYQSSFELWLLEGLTFRIGDDIQIELQNDNGQPLYINYIIDRTGIDNLYIDEGDAKYYQFVRAFFDRLHRYGSVKLTIYVDMLDWRENPIQYLPFDLYFDNELDLYIRD